METAFNKHVFHEFTVSKGAQGKPDGGQWISLPLDEFALLRDQVFAVESIHVSVGGADVPCPWLAAWGKRELVGRQHRMVDGIPCPPGMLGHPTESKFHGICMPGKKSSSWKQDRLPIVLRHNVVDFFMSDLQDKYLQAKGEVLKRGSLRKCCGSSLKTYYADETVRDGAIECFLKEPPDSTGTPGSALEQFASELLDNETTCYLMQQSSYPLLERLCRYGVPIEEDIEAFPPLVRVQHSRIDPVREYGIVPLDAVRKMFMFCQVLEQNNFVYYMGSQTSGVPAVHVYVPATSARSFVASARVRLQVGLSGLPVLDDKQFPYQVDFPGTDFNVMAMTCPLSCSKDPDAERESLKHFEGIQSLRFSQALNFDV